jgi:hypothetical protein
MSVRGPYSDRSPTRRGRSRQLLAGQAVSNAKRTMLVHRLAEKTGDSFASNGLRRIASGYTAEKWIGPR